MVRAFHPQAFTNSLTTNTNYPPQIFDESGGGRREGFEAIGSSPDIILYNTGTETGNLKYIEQ